MATQHVRAACRKALADYLQTQLGATREVSDRWPTPGQKLTREAVSVLLAPSKDRESKYQPVPLSQTELDPPDAVDALILYSWGTVECGIQIDCWANYSHTRDTLALDVEEALNRPPSVTVGGNTTALDLAPNLVIAVPDNFNTPAFFRFSAFPGLPENSGVAQSATWRATWMGSATAHLLRQVQRPRIKTLKLIQSGSGIVGSQTQTLYP